MIKFEILSRWSGSVKFVAEIDCSEDAPRRLKVGLAVRWAIKARANLTGADLSGADLRGADLRGANLGDANLDQTRGNAYTTLPFGYKVTDAGLIVRTDG